MDEIAARLAGIRERAVAAAMRSGREPDQVEVMVVSKTFPAEVVRGVVEAGQVLLGENKVQEALDKAPQLGEGLRWHLIGQLQRNKVRKALPLFEAVHSVDSLKLARQIDRVAGELDLRPLVYLQVNVGAEESKGGFGTEKMEEAVDEIKSMPHLRVEGLMCIPPAGPDARRWFSTLRELRDGLQAGCGVPLPGLSMGMSHDFEVAIEEGATMVRVGSAVFGERTRMVNQKK